MSHKQAKRNRKANPGPSKYELRRMQDAAMAKAVTIQDQAELIDKEPRRLSPQASRLQIAALLAALQFR